MSFFESDRDRAIVIALDLGVFGSESFVTGIEDLSDAIARMNTAGADVLQVNVGGLRMIQRNPTVQERCIALIQQVRAALADSDTALMVEPLVMRRNADGIIGGAFEASDLVALVRQGVELGADAIKVDAPSDATQFRRLVEVATPIPVLLRGGGKVTEQVILERAKAAIDAGARGVVFGRNVVQHPNPPAFLAALRAVVHDNASIDEAMKHLGA